MDRLLLSLSKSCLYLVSSTFLIVKLTNKRSVSGHPIKFERGDNEAKHRAPKLGSYTFIPMTMKV